MKKFLKAIKTVKCLDDADLLIEGVSETAENEVEEQKSRFSSMLAVALGATLLGNMLAGNR